MAKKAKKAKKKKKKQESEYTDVSCHCGSYNCSECNPRRPRSRMLFPGCSFGKCND